MFRYLLYLLVVFSVIACNGKKDENIHYPSEQYEYISADTTKTTVNSIIYVPVYSHVYVTNGTRPLNLAATLSIRSMDPADSILISGVDYYNSRGELIKKYLSKILLLRPMHSAEFVVEENNTEGGAGAYFIIHAFAPKPESSLLVQAIMASQEGSLGIAFKTDGIILEKKTPN